VQQPGDYAGAGGGLRGFLGDERGLVLVGQHLGGGSLSEGGQRTDMVRVTMGNNDSLELIEAVACIVDQASDILEFVAVPGIDEGKFSVSDQEKDIGDLLGCHTVDGEVGIRHGFLPVALLLTEIPYTALQRSCPRCRRQSIRNGFDR